VPDFSFRINLELYEKILQAKLQRGDLVPGDASWYLKSIRSKFPAIALVVELSNNDKAFRDYLK
jgi:hypothetical protein